MELLCTAMELAPPRRQLLMRACGFAPPLPSSSGADYLQSPAQLPRDIPDFVGRAGLLRALLDRLLPEPSDSQVADGPPIVAISGLGGIGKTTLALHLAHQVRAAYQDGQLFLDLEGGSGGGRDPDSVLSAVLRDLGVPIPRIPADLASKSALLRSCTVGRKVLLVLDNARDTAQIRPLLPGSPSCAVLITSRRYLAALDGAQHANIGPLADDQARELLAGARSIQPDDKDPLDQIVAYCAGLPLALRIAAARLASPGSPGVPAFAAQLTDAAGRLDRLTVEDLSVRRTLDASVALLDVTDPVGRLARRVLSFLGSWPGGAVGPDCVAAALGTTTQHVGQALAQLADNSLLETRAQDRYAPHDLVKLVVRGQEPAPADSVSAAFDWYLHAVDRAAALFATYSARLELAGPPPPDLPEFADGKDAIRWCERENDNIFSLIKYGAAVGWDLRACQLVIMSMPFCEQRMHLTQWIDSLLIGVDCARRAGDQLLEARCESGLGAAYRWTGQFTFALRHSEASLTIFTELGEWERLGAALINHGRLSHARKDYPAAISAFRQAVDHLRAGGRPSWLAPALNQLGMALTRGGQPEAAVPYQLESVQVASQAGLGQAVNIALLNLSFSYAQLGQLDEASHAIEQAAEAVAGLEDTIPEAEILRQMAEVRAAQGRRAEAADLFWRSLQMMDDIGYPEADAVRRRLNELTDVDRLASPEEAVLWVRWRLRLMRPR